MLKMSFYASQRGFDLTCFNCKLYFSSLYMCLNGNSNIKLFCCCGAEDYSIDYNCVNGILIFLPFTFLLSGCHIHFQEFRNEMCDIPIPGKFVSKRTNVTLPWLLDI